MSHASKVALASLASGAVFGVGLLLSGMTQPEKVLGFLDLAGAWDPSLALVMVGAIGVHALGVRALTKSAPPSSARSSFAVKGPIDARLLVGAAIFGVGWGLAGYCPGPSVVALASGGAGALGFVATMLVGIAVASRLEAWLASQARSASREPRDELGESVGFVSSSSGAPET